MVGTSRQYNVRDDMKDSFDQAGLDDIKLEDSLQKNAPLFTMPTEVFAQYSSHAELSCAHRYATIFAIFRLPEISLNVTFEFFLTGAKRPTFVLSDASNGQRDLLAYYRQ